MHIGVTGRVIIRNAIVRIIWDVVNFRVIIWGCCSMRTQRPTPELKPTELFFNIVYHLRRPRHNHRLRRNGGIFICSSRRFCMKMNRCRFRWSRTKLLLLQFMALRYSRYNGHGGNSPVYVVRWTTGIIGVGGVVDSVRQGEATRIIKCVRETALLVTGWKLIAGRVDVPR